MKALAVVLDGNGLYVTSSDTNILRFKREIERILDISNHYLRGVIVVMLDDSNKVDRIYCYGDDALKIYTKYNWHQIRDSINNMFLNKSSSNDPYKKFIIDLMEFKKSKIKQVVKDGAADKYFTEEDKQDILKWSSVSAKFVCIKLACNILSGYEGLHSYLCPFCIYNNFMCFRCSYGKHHGLCCDIKSDHNILLGKIADANPKDFLTTEDYNNFLSKYREVIYG